jgi:hypothetical protein
MFVRRISLLTGGLLAAVAAVTVVPSASGAASRPLPTHDSFYRYTGHRPIAKVAPGTVLKKRVVQVSLGTTSPTPMNAEQLLYRTRNELGKPAVTVTTVLNPSAAPAAPGILAYLSFYDALGSVCDPSYTLAGGDPGPANAGQAQDEEAIIASYVGQGYVVTVPDFEGTKLDWAAGQESGYGTLDGIRATESFLKVPQSTKVGMSGYSGGSIAAEWASELAPHYAPKLNIVGVAEGGIPVDFAHNLPYINGSPSWSGVMPAVFVSLARAFHLNFRHYLSGKGRKLTRQVAGKCIGSFSGAYPGLKIQSMLKHRYKKILTVPAFARIVNRLLMGSSKGHPHTPLFMAVGKDSDGIGDGVMVAKDVEALAHEYCSQHVKVQLTTYQGSTHTQAGVKFEPDAITFLNQRFAGTPFSSGCSSIGKGNSLKPLPIRKHRKHHK